MAANINSTDKNAIANKLADMKTLNNMLSQDDLQSLQEIDKAMTDL